VSLLLISAAPMILVIGFSVLLGLWLAPCHTEGRKKEDHLIRPGSALAALGLLWLAALGLHQGLLPVATPGQLAAATGVLIWAGHCWVQHRISQKKLTVLPLVSAMLLVAAGTVAGLGQPAAPPEAFANPRAAVHIALSLAAVTLLIGSGVFGAGELILHRQIVQRRFGKWFHDLPSLADLSRLRRLSLTSGWALMTVSVVLAMAGLWLLPTAREATISHLHPMLTLWVILSALWAAERFRWLTQLKLAAASVAVSALMVVLIVISVVEFFGGRLA
jgi:ABC-type uncharacterized transport system permease subunit